MVTETPFGPSARGILKFRYFRDSTTMREFPMLKILAATTVCMITLTACGAVNSLMEERFRIRHRRITLADAGARLEGFRFKSYREGEE